MLTDEQFAANEQRYKDHMARFVAAHKDVPNGAILIELERRERWRKIMGAAADVLEPPQVETVDSHP